MIRLLLRNQKPVPLIPDAWGNVTESNDSQASVSYTYYSNGKPKNIICGNNTVQISYDDRGDQIALTDPDAGTTTYVTDALHRVIEQTDARNYVSSYVFDDAGRMTSKSVGGLTTTYTYGTSGGAAGRLVTEYNPNGSTAYSYDDKGRLSSEVRTISGVQPLTFSYSYDNIGRLIRKSYPQNVMVDYAYNGDYLVATAVNGRNVSSLDSDNGLVKVCTYGGTLRTIHNDSTQLRNPGELSVNENFAENGLGTHVTTHDSRGYLSSLTMYRGQSPVHTMTFGFESGTGNLLSRSGMLSQSESFSYDALDRLIAVSHVGNETFQYSTDGNITYKSGVGTLSYNSPTHAHAVTGATNEGYIPSTPQSITYTPFGKVHSISQGSYTMDFTYGPDQQRWMTVLQNGNSTIRTVIYGNDYEKVTENGQTRHFYFLDGGAIYVLDDGTGANNGQLYYAFTDHLGSVTRLYSESGNEVFTAKYDAWGKQTITTNSLQFRHGYTGHEMMPEFGLINMNGRLYDPALGRFLSPDNYVQLPDFSQSFNRYSYCLNNPLKYTDPSGEFWHLVLGAVIGGMMNCAMNAHNIDSFWEGFGYFGIGALAGAVSVGIASGVNVTLAGGSFSAGFWGNATGVASTGFISGSLTGAASGFSGAFITEASNSWMNGDGFGKGLLNGLRGGGMAALTAGVSGGITGGFDALEKGTNFWTGKSSFDLSKAYTAHGFIPGEETVTGTYVGKFEGENVFENELIMGDINKGSNYRGATFPGRGILVSKGVLTGGGSQGRALLQHEFGHILQFREVGAKAYYSLIAPASLASACRSEIKHDCFWTETWANYLSKEYFGANWLGNKYKYIAQPLNSINRFIVNLARMPIVWSPVLPINR